MSTNQVPQMREVSGLNMPDTCPAVQTWKPIFELADVLNVKVLAMPNRGGVWTLCIPIEVKPYVKRFPSTQSFNTRHLIFTS